MMWLCLDHCLVDEGGAVNTGAEDAPMTRIFMLKNSGFPLSMRYAGVRTEIDSQHL